VSVQPESVARGRLARRLSLVLNLLGPLATAALLFLWARSSTRLLGWELARDHERCLALESLPLQIRSEDAEAIMRWFEGRGTRMPVLPAQVGDLEPIGARYGWMPDLRRTAHVFYGSERNTASLYVMGPLLSAPSPVRVGARGLVIWIGHAGGTRVAVVAARAEIVDAFARAFETTVASGRPGH
jgi:hypothetical protein